MAGDQQPLTPARRNRLRAIWQAVLERSGAEVEFREDLPGQEVRGEELPPVTPVRLPDQLPILLTAQEDLRQPRA